MSIDKQHSDSAHRNIHTTDKMGLLLWHQLVDYMPQPFCKEENAVGFIFIHGSFHFCGITCCHGELILGHMPGGWLTGLFTVLLEHLSIFYSVQICIVFLSRVKKESLRRKFNTSNQKHKVKSKTTLCASKKKCLLPI